MRPKFKNLMSDITYGCLRKSLSKHTYFERSKKMPKERVVFLITGFLTSDKSVSQLEVFLKKRNTKVYTLKDCLKGESFVPRNINIGWRDEYRDLIKKKAIKVRAETGEMPYIIGWSLGGIYALNIHKEEPGLFKKVVTLASPLNKSFSENTSIKWLYNLVSGNAKYLDEIIAKNSTIRDVNSVVTVGAERDGLIDYKACVSPYTKSYVVDCYHMDITSAPKALKIIEKEMFGIKNNIF
jgi:esterase/lipase superfamily enzyme